MEVQPLGSVGSIAFSGKYLGLLLTTDNLSKALELIFEAGFLVQE